MSQRGGVRDAVVRLPPHSETAVLAAIAALSSTILLKFANVQYLEFLEFALLAYVAFRFVRSDFRLELSRGLFRIVVGYGLLSFLILLSCMLAFTRPFYLYTVGMNSPGWVSFARLAELALGVFATVTLSEVFRRSPAKCLFTARVYFYTGTLSALLGLMGIAVHGVFLRFTTGEHRVSGFFNEGGPYGLYILSVLLVGLTLRRQQERHKPAFLMTSMVINGLALIFSASKAAYVALALLLVIQVLYAGGWRQRVWTGSIAFVCLTAFTFTSASRGIAAYVDGGRRFEAVSQMRPDDINFSYGRVAGLFFVPRMVAAHPWLGVGFANYGLVRNAPEYRGNAAVAVFVDHDGLGIFGLTAELGLPATALLVYLLAQPALMVRRLTHWKAGLALGFMQLVAHLCGAQLNVTYPWITGALALGMATIANSQGLQRLPSKNLALTTNTSAFPLQPTSVKL